MLGYYSTAYDIQLLCNVMNVLWQLELGIIQLMCNAMKCTLTIRVRNHIILRNSKSSAEQGSDHYWITIGSLSDRCRITIGSLSDHCRVIMVHGIQLMCNVTKCTPAIRVRDIILRNSKSSAMQGSD